jgi:hypothetical protein
MVRLAQNFGMAIIRGETGVPDYSGSRIKEQGERFKVQGFSNDPACSHRPPVLKRRGVPIGPL